MTRALGRLALGAALTVGSAGCAPLDASGAGATHAGLLTDQSADRILGQADALVRLPNRWGSPSSPNAIALDASVSPPRVWVADTANNRVLMWPEVAAWAAGLPPTVVVGQPDLATTTANSGGLNAASLSAPSGVAADTTGNLWIVDRGNNRVLGYNIPYAGERNADRVLGQTSFTVGTCNTGGIGAATLCSPEAVALDAAGNVAVADTGNHRVIEYDNPLVTSNTVADRVFGQSTFAARACNGGGVTASSLCDPTGVGLDGAGSLFIADKTNHRVLGYDAILTTDAVADRVFGQMGFFNLAVCNVGGAVGNQGLCSPWAVAIDSANSLWVADTNNNRVVQFVGPTSSDVVADRVLGQTDSFTTAVCDVMPSQLCGPRGVAVTAAGDVLVADTTNNRVVVFDAAASSDTVADHWLAVGASGLVGPRAVALDRSASPNRVWVADTINHRVLGWRDADGWANAEPADLVLGQPNLNSRYCNAGGVGPSSLCSPASVAVDPSGNVYVADSGNNRVLEYDAPYAALDTTADRVLGQSDSFTASTCNASGIGAGSLCNPLGAAVASTGDLYVADTNNNRVLYFDDPTRFDTTADRSFGQLGSFTSAIVNAAGLSASSLNGPQAAGVDGADNLFVADTGNHRVLGFVAPTAGGDSIADRVFGQAGSFTSAVCNFGGSPAPGSLCGPSAVAGDEAGNLFVVDRTNHRVLEFFNAMASDAVADRVFGQSGSLSGAACNRTGLSATTVCDPGGVAIDSAASLYVADTGNHRVLFFGGCSTSAECNDADPCTTDSCVGLGCRHTAVVCAPSGPCVTATCTAGVGCRETSLPDGTACPDGDLCNGDETCAAGACTPGAPLSCTDPSACIQASCDPAAGCVQTNRTDGTPCPDGDPCNGDEICTAGSCDPGSPPSNCCVSDPDCNDGTACTVDACDLSANRCTFTSVAGCCTMDTDCADTDPCTTESCRTADATCVYAAVTGCCHSAADCGATETCQSNRCAGPASPPGGCGCAVVGVSVAPVGWALLGFVVSLALAIVRRRRS